MSSRRLFVPRFTACETLFDRKNISIRTLNYIYENNLLFLFANAIAKKLFLSLSSTVASGECIFSKLKLIKN